MYIRKYLQLSLLLMPFIFGVNNVTTAADPEPAIEGAVISFTDTKGEKGFLLPRVSLKKLDSYLPIVGEPIIGILVENTASTGDIPRGIYRWNGQSWTKLLDQVDMGSITLGAKVYTGAVDPNLSQDKEIINAAGGSLYIQEGRNEIYIKEKKAWRLVLKKDEVTKYVGSNSIIITPNANGNEVGVIAGLGIKTSQLGVSVNIDSTNLKVDSDGKLAAKSDVALWNASKLQGQELNLSGSSKDGEVIKYKNGKWTNAKEPKYQPGDGIQIDTDNNKIHTNIDSTKLSIDSAGKLTAKSDEALWNATKLQGQSLSLLSSLKNGEVLKYKDGTWTNQEERKYQAGKGIQIDTNNKIHTDVDSASLSIDSAGKLAAKFGEALWNATKLQGQELNLSGSSKNREVLKYKDGTWTNQEERKYQAGKGIQIDTNNKIHTDIDSVSLSIDSAGKLAAKSGEALWNATKLQGQELNLSGSSKNGEVLRYKDGAWTNQEERKYQAGKGIQIDTDNNKIHTNIDSTKLSIDSAGKLTAKSDEALWNAIKLQGQSLLLLPSPKNGEVLKYKDGTWTNQEEGQYYSGKGIAIDIDIDNKIHTNIDSTKLSIDNAGKLTARAGDALWNASKLNNFSISSVAPTRIGQLLVWDGSHWTPQTKDKIVDIQGNVVRIPDLEGSYSMTPSHNLLMVDERGKLKLMYGMPWTLEGNKDIFEGYKTIGFTDSLSEANLDIMTKGQPRLRFLSDGSIQMVTRPIEKKWTEGYGLLTIDNNTGTIYQYKLTPWMSNGNSEIISGDKVLGFTNKESVANLEIRTNGQMRMRFENDGTIRANIPATNHYNDMNLLSRDPFTGEIVTLPSDLFWNIDSDSVNVKTKYIEFPNLPEVTTTKGLHFIMIDPVTGQLFRAAKFSPIFGAFASEKYRDIKNEYLGTMQEIGASSNSYKEFKIPLNLEENSAGKIELYITSASSKTGPASRLKPIIVILDYDYFTGFEPRITGAVIVGGMQGSSIPFDIMDHSTDSMTNDVPSATFKTKAGIERKPFTLGSIYITSADTDKNKYHLNLSIKRSSQVKASDNEVKLRVKLVSNPIEVADDF